MTDPTLYWRTQQSALAKGVTATLNKPIDPRTQIMTGVNANTEIIRPVNSYQTGSGPGSSQFANTDPRRLDNQQAQPGTTRNMPAKPTLSPLMQGNSSPHPPVTSVVLVDAAATKVETNVIKTAEYPLGIVQTGYFLSIMLGPYDVDVALSGNKVQHDLNYAFPLPSNLLSSTALDYTNINLGAFGGEFLKSAVLLGQAAKNGDLLGQVRAEVNSAMQAVFNKDDASVRQLVTRRILSGISPQLGSAVDLASGSTPNPHVAVTFNNVKLRSFTYTWKFSPNSEPESNRLKEMIEKLHQRILPKKKGNLLLEYPNQCQLQFCPDQLNNLFKFKPCVIDSLNVNYAPSGVPSFFANSNLPTEIELSMTFHEIQLRTSEDYASSGA